MREMFHWHAQVQRGDTGEVVTRAFSSFWSPEKVEQGSIAVAVAAVESYATKVKHVPTSARLVEAA